MTTFELTPAGPFSPAASGVFLEERAQAWRPYRTWVVLLLRVLLEAETDGLGGTRDVGGRPR
jgi:hypothetical protein